MSKIVIKIDMAKYKSIDVDINDALNILEKIKEVTQKNPSDINEVIRYINNFDEFYSYMQRKFKDYIAPPHKPDDYIKGLAFIDRVRLYKDSEGNKRIVIVFDRRVRVETLKDAIEKAGYEVEVSKEI